MIGGDVNWKSLKNGLKDFPLIKKLKTGPTRGRLTLDILYTDLPNTSAELLNPIETEDGIQSDHKTIVAHHVPGIEEKKETYYYFTQPLKKNDKEKFKNLLITTNWENIVGENCSVSANNL